MIVKTKLIPNGFQAVSVWPFIFVLPEVSGNTGLIEHEMVHYKEQAWTTPIWWFKYVFSKSFRKAAEIRAYRKQIEVGGISQAGAAAMMLKYNLDITFEEAFGLLYI